MSHRLHPVPGFVKEAEIIVHEADEPDLVSDLSYPHILDGEHRAEVDLAPSDADPPALGHPHGAVTKVPSRYLAPLDLSNTVPTGQRMRWTGWHLP